MSEAGLPPVRLARLAARIEVHSTRTMPPRRRRAEAEAAAPRSAEAEAATAGAPSAAAAPLAAGPAGLKGAVVLFNDLKGGAAVEEGAVRRAVTGLEGFFIAALRARELRPRQRAAEDADQNTAEAAYRAWLRKHYRVFTRRLLGLLTRPGMTTKVRLAALGALMELARAEQQGSFANELYVEAIRALVTGHGLTPEVLGALVGRYLKFADVRFYTYVALGGVAGGVDEAAARDDDDDDDGADDDDGGEMAPALRPSDVARNTYDVLCSVPPDFRDWTADGSNAEGDVEWDPVEAWCREDGVTPPAKKKRKKVGADGKEVQPRWASGSKHRKAFSDAWIAVLRMPFPEDILKSVLVRLHSNVIPHMLNPVLLSDFLTASIDAGGLIGMLALNGLFVLMTQHGLEYPSFYRRLYTLLDATSFHLTRRKRFFELLDIFLKSTLLPAYVGAAFAKKLARLALHAPPAGALVAIAFVHNLVRRHPACAVLLNREKLPASAQGAKGDPFDAEELDPAKCRALESSLWEMATLQNHYCPQVARFVSVLEKDLSKRDKTAELPVSDLASGSYASLVEEEVERRLKSVPLAFYSDAERPQTLFGAPDDAERFGGWSLS